MVLGSVGVVIGYYSNLNGWWQGVKINKCNIFYQQNGLSNGIEIEYHLDGSINRLIYRRDNKRHGIEIGYNSNGSGWFKHWHYGKRHGIEIVYTWNRLIDRLIHWYNGKQHGIEIDYNLNGKKIE